MIIEKTRCAFDPVVLPLTLVGAGASKDGAVIDFGFEKQMVETNEVLEVYVAETATSAGAATVQVKVSTRKVATDPWVVVQSGEVHALAAVTEGAVIFKNALADRCHRFVMVSLDNASAATFTAGSVVGVVRPL